MWNSVFCHTGSLQIVFKSVDESLVCDHSDESY